MSINVAVVGTGEVARAVHLPSWRHVHHAQVGAVCDVNRDAAEKVAKDWGISHFYTDFAELLQHERPRLVDICTPPATHLPLTVQALSAGCSVILEKPMAMTLEDADQIMKAYDNRGDRGLKLGVVHNWLFEPPIMDMLSMVKAGVIGDVVCVELKALSTERDPMVADPNHWCHSLPGGRFGEGFIHLIYLMYRLLGDVRIESICISKTGNCSWVPYDEVLITCKSGKRLGTIYNSINSPIIDVPSITIYGTDSHLRYESYNLTPFSRHPSPESTFGKGMDMLREIWQLSKSLSREVLAKATHRHRKSAHEIYFSLFVQSILEGGELPLEPAEAFEANKIFLDVLDRLESLKPWRSSPAGGVSAQMELGTDQ